MLQRCSERTICDYYGKEAFVKLHDFLVSGENLGREITMGMGGFILKNTLSDNGTVTRGKNLKRVNCHFSKIYVKYLCIVTNFSNSTWILHILY